MEFRGIPRAMLAVAAVGIAVLAGIGTAGSFGGGDSLWGDRSEGTADRSETVLRAPAIRGAVDSVITFYENVLDAGRHGAAASLYLEDAVTSQPGAPAAEGRASIRSSLEQSFPAEARLEVTSVDVQVLSPEWASVYGSASVSGSGNVDADREAATRPVTFFALLRKSGDGWKVVREAVSSNR